MSLTVLPPEESIEIPSGDGDLTFRMSKKKI